MVYFLLIRENESAVFFWLKAFFHKLEIYPQIPIAVKFPTAVSMYWIEESFVIHYWILFEGAFRPSFRGRGRLHQSAVVQGRGAGEEHRVQYGVFLSDRPVVFSLKCKVMSSLKSNINGVTQESLILCKFVCYSLGRQVEEKD